MSIGRKDPAAFTVVSREGDPFADLPAQRLLEDAAFAAPFGAEDRGCSRVNVSVNVRRVTT